MNMQLTNVRQLVASSAKANPSVGAEQSFRAAIAAVRSAAREYEHAGQAAKAAFAACRAVETEHNSTAADERGAGESVPVPAILRRPRKAPAGNEVIKVIMERADGTDSVLDFTTPDEAEYTMSYDGLAEYYQDDQATLAQAQHAYSEWQFAMLAARQKLAPAIVLEARAAAKPAYEARSNARRARDAACEALLTLTVDRPSDEYLRIRVLLEAHGAHITRAGGVSNFDEILDNAPRMASRIFKLMLDGWRCAESTHTLAATDTALADYVAAKNLDAHLAHHGGVGDGEHGDQLAEAEDALLSTAPTDLSGVSARLGAIISLGWLHTHGDWDCPLCPEKRAKTLATITPPEAGELFDDAEGRDDALFRALAFLHQGIDRLPGAAATASAASHQSQSAAA